MKPISYLCATLCSPLLIAAPAAATKRPPNVVVILVDDMGWGDIGANGSRHCKTPNIDRLAGEGVRFTQGYAAAAVCSPSRAGLLTGRSPARLHVTDWIPGEGGLKTGRFDLPDWTKRLDPKVPNLATTLAARGYVTAAIGKWHLGGTGSLPQECGFSLNIAGGHGGQPASYFWPYGKEGSPLRVPGLAESGGAKGEYLTDRITDEAIRFMDTNKGTPFFLYLPHFAVHAPLQAKESDITAAVENAPSIQGQDNKKYAAMVKSVDDSVGRLCAEIKKLGLEEDTIVVFTSDNGASNHGGGSGPTWSHPLRGGKAFPYEGGMREPFVIKAPGVTKPGLVSDTPVIHTDLHTTLAALCGAKAPAKSDGVDITPALRGEPMPSRSLGWHFPHYWCGGLISPYSVLRDGDWKIVRWYEYDTEEVYNLAADPTESHDLAKENPAKRKELARQLDAWLKSNQAQLPVLRKKAGPAPAPEKNPAVAAEWFAEAGK